MPLAARTTFFSGFNFNANLTRSLFCTARTSFETVNKIFLSLQIQQDFLYIYFTPFLFCTIQLFASTYKSFNGNLTTDTKISDIFWMMCLLKKWHGIHTRDLKIRYTRVDSYLYLLNILDVFKTTRDLHRASDRHYLAAHSQNSSSSFSEVKIKDATFSRRFTT